MKTKIKWIFTLVILIWGYLQTSAQTVYQAGSYKLLVKSGNYFEIEGSDTIPITTDKLLVRFKENLTENEKNNFAQIHLLCAI